MEIRIGSSNTAQTTVSNSNTAATVGSGSLDVFATPMMVALMENAAAGCIQPALQPGQTSVGTFIETAHLAATPLGMAVTATATVVAVNGREVQFELSASDEAGPIGKGRHTRVVVDAGRFMEKTGAKRK